METGVVGIEGVKGRGGVGGWYAGIKAERNNPVLIFFRSECQSAVFWFLSITHLFKSSINPDFEYGLLTMVIDDIKNWWLMPVIDGY